MLLSLLPITGLVQAEMLLFCVSQLLFLYASWHLLPKNTNADNDKADSNKGAETSVSSNNAAGSNHDADRGSNHGATRSNDGNTNVLAASLRAFVGFYPLMRRLCLCLPPALICLTGIGVNLREKEQLVAFSAVVVFGLVVHGFVLSLRLVCRWCQCQTRIHRGAGWIDVVGIYYIGSRDLGSRDLGSRDARSDFIQLS